MPWGKVEGTEVVSLTAETYIERSDRILGAWMRGIITEQEYLDERLALDIERSM